MGKYLQLNIAKPCHENWNHMTSSEQGRFCNSCQKSVIDFTLMSDLEVANFFKNKSNNVCGRLTQDQLNNALAVPQKRIPWLKYFFQITIPAFLFSSKASAQLKTIGEITVVQTKKDPASLKIPVDTIREVTGTVVNEEGKPIPFASVAIKNTRRGVTTDADGRFSIKLSPSNTTLVFSSVGSASEEADFSRVDSKQIIMHQNTIMYLGGIGSVVTRKPKKCTAPPVMDNKIVVPVTHLNSFTLFPNPVTVGSTMNVKYHDNIVGHRIASIYNSNGELLSTQSISFNKKAGGSVAVKGLSPGTYIISITDPKNKKSDSQQFLVQ
jgi:hypothetical protein